MAFSKENRLNTLSGIWFVALFAMASVYLSEFAIFQNLGLSPLVIAIVLGMIYGNTLRGQLPEAWAPGIIFSAKKILRFAIVFYGFRITFQQIADVGLAGFVISVVMVVSTFLIGVFVAKKFFKLDSDTAFLTASGSSICGAAAVLATEPVLKAEPHKSALAVSTVVLFGTIAMFVYPLLYNSGILDMDLYAFGVYTGATIHEVAQVVAVGGAFGGDAADNAIIVKMTRVMMIAPMLIILGIYLAKVKKSDTSEANKLVIPWFAVYFILVAGFNSFNLVPVEAVNVINSIDTFLLTMAMAALGMEASFSKFKNIGMAPVYVAFIMFLWLMIGGYFITKGVLAVV